MKQFIQSLVKPLLASRYNEITKWRDLGDPTLENTEQSDSSVSAATIINGELGAAFEGGEWGLGARIEAMQELLCRLVDGEPMFQTSKHEGMVHRALRGGWHFHKTTAGVVLRNEPVKDQHAAIGDALSHGIARIFQYKQKPFTKTVIKAVGRTYEVPELYGERKYA